VYVCMRERERESERERERDVPTNNSIRSELEYKLFSANVFASLFAVVINYIHIHINRIIIIPWVHDQRGAENG